MRVMHFCGILNPSENQQASNRDIPLHPDKRILSQVSTGKVIITVLTVGEPCLWTSNHVTTHQCQLLLQSSGQAECHLLGSGCTSCIQPGLNTMQFSRFWTTRRKPSAAIFLHQMMACKRL